MKLLLDLLEDGEKLILEHGGRASLQKFGIVVVIGLEAVTETLLKRGDLPEPLDAWLTMCPDTAERFLMGDEAWLCREYPEKYR